ncbi:MAG: MaoC/PaaZ C-terminal domain-containing protein [Actinocatenispora sp.]
MPSVELDRRPGLAASYASALLPRRRGTELPDDELVLPRLAVDRTHLAGYERVCGFPRTDRLPATYLQVLAFPLAMRLMAGRRFPFPLPGLVHVRNRVELLRPVDADEPVTLRVRAEALAPHRRGTTVDLVTRASARDGEVYVARATYLRRGPTLGEVSGSGDGGGGDNSGEADAPVSTATDTGTEPRSDGEPERGAEPVPPGAVWSLPAGLGRRYAAVSGDRNPIHLSRLTARPFGFRTAIVHGMWSAARCLAALEGRLPEALAADVCFVRPVRVPGRVAFGARPAGEGWEFAVSAPRSGRTLVAGRVEPR